MLLGLFVFIWLELTQGDVAVVMKIHNLIYI